MTGIAPAGGVAGILSRVQQIESRFSGPVAANPAAASASSTPSAAAQTAQVLGVQTSAGDEFADLLMAATGRTALAAPLGTSTSVPIGQPVSPVGGVRSATGTGTGALDPSTPYADLFAAAGARHGIDPRVLSAVAKVESGYNPNAVSRAGARGLMQFMPATAAGMGIDPMDPAQAIDGAARYLSTQMRDFGSLDLALAAYNAGPGAVRRHGGIPPYAETQAYVPKVLGILNGGS